MNTDSEILRSLGLRDLNIDVLLIILIAVLIILVISIIITILQMSRLKKLKNRLDKFMKGKDGKSLETEISRIMDENKLLRENMKKNAQNIDTLYQRMKTTFQKMGIVKYDAFNQMGGQLSYSLALLDENNNGFIINSVHSNEGSYSYTKEIKGGVSDISLGKEEQEALDLAMEK